MIKLSQPKIPESAITRVGEILRSGQLVHGEECLAFEQELADYLGSSHVLVVSNGTAALHLALLSLDIGHGDAVIVPDFTFAATANIVEMTGAKAVIVDVEPTSYNMCPKQLEERIKAWQGPENLKAIMPVLEFGNPKNLNLYRTIADKYDLRLIEDSACALGASENGVNVGTVGDFGCFSFHPRKTLTTGEGGAIVTSNRALYEKAMLLRNHGMERCEGGIKFKCIGLNYRLTNFQAAIGRSILPELDNWIEKRRSLAEAYCLYLKPLIQSGCLRIPMIEEGHSLQTFMVVLEQDFDRATVLKSLLNKGIEANSGAQSMSSLGLFNSRHNHSSSFPIGNTLYLNGLALPLHENLEVPEVKYVCNALTNIIQDLKHV